MRHLSTLSKQSAFRPRASRRRHGVATIEFAFVLLFMVPLLLGTAGYGILMLRSLAVIQLARDAGHMFARGSDFSQPGNKTILTTLGADLGLSTDPTRSSSVVILSAVTYIDTNMCAADGKVDTHGNPSGCTNYRKWAFTRRIIVGNTSLRMSNFGRPIQEGINPVTVDSAGKISVHDQVSNAGDVATFTSINPYALVNGSVSGLPSGQVIYISEAAAETLNVPLVPAIPVYSYTMF